MVKTTAGVAQALNALCQAAITAGRASEEDGEFEDTDLKVAALDYYHALKRASAKKAGRDA